MYFAAFRLSQMGWKVMPTARNARGIEALVSGTVLSTTVSSGSAETVYGLADATTVLSSGTETVVAGGTASGTTISASGVQLVVGGGLAASASVSGEQDVIRLGRSYLGREWGNAPATIAAGTVLEVKVPDAER
jgi:autotransporter passenger strand-loop-strand repeat protein